MRIHKNKLYIMKKKVLFYALVCILTISNLKAADLYVRDLGAGGSYPTISAAITAASDGDRIIIRPKAAGLPFIENLTINKSLTFVSETNFSKYVLQGEVSVTPLAGRVVTIHNMSSASTIKFSTSTTGGRTTLNLLNSLFTSVNCAYANTSVNMSGCDVSAVNITHGRLTGNKTSTITVQSSTTKDTNFSDDEIEIIANKIGGSVTFEQTGYAFKFLNNYLGLSALRVAEVKAGSVNEIRNNVINGGEYGSISISQSDNYGTFFILNNVLTCNSTLSNYYEINNSNTKATVYAVNNASTTNFTTNGVAVSNGNFTSSLTFNIFSSTVSGSGIINAGVADDEYADIDLSRNDIGNFGGSDSWANYWPTAAGNKPQVNYLKTPRRIYTGTTEMNAIGSGYSK